MVTVYIVKGIGLENYGIIFDVWTSKKKADEHVERLKEVGHLAKVEKRVTCK